MDAQALQSTYFTLMVALGCAWASGISPFLTVLVLGLMVRAHAGTEQAGGLLLLSSPWILIPAGLIFAVEFVVDKLPRWDVPWHRRSGWLRVGAAVALAAMAGGGGAFPLDVRIVVAILGGVGAFVVHVARTSAHIAMHRAGTQNFATPLSGVVEEFLLCSILLPLGLGSPGLTTMMLGVSTLAAALILYLTWSEAKPLMLEMLLGAEPPAPPPGPEGTAAGPRHSSPTE